MVALHLVTSPTASSKIQPSTKAKIRIKNKMDLNLPFIFKYQCENKFTASHLEWIAADYMVLATILLACATWPWLANNSEKMKNHSFRNSVKAIVYLFLGMTCFVLITDNRLQQQLYQDCHKFLELPTQEKLTFLTVIGLIISFVYLAKTVRSWIIATYSLTLYYVLVIGVRAGFLFYKVDVQVFLSVEVGLILVALVWVFCKRKPEAILEWGKLLVEMVKVVFYMQLTLMGAYFLAVLLCQPSPCFWVYANAVFLLFEATLCLGKVLAEMTSADGVLWEKVRSGVEEIKTLVSPDYIPAF